MAQMPPNSSSSTRSGFSDSTSVALSAHVQQTIELMNRDLQQITNRMNCVERSVADMKQNLVRKVLVDFSDQRWNVTIDANICVVSISFQASNKYPTWWPFKDISPAWFTFIIVWPFIVNKLFRPRQK
jgi:hypothetical protein